MNKPSYFAIIPAKVRYDEELTNSQKIMFGEITALANKRGYCNASNGYFSKLYNVDPSTVSKWIKGLEKQGYIEIKYTREGKRIKGRNVRPLMDHKGIELNQGGTESDQQGIEESPGGVLIKPQGGIEYNAKKNSTSNNNTSENKSAREDSENDFIPPTQEEVEDYFEKKDKMLEEDIPLEAEKFINHYADEDWKKGNGKK